MWRSGGRSLRIASGASRMTSTRRLSWLAARQTWRTSDRFDSIHWETERERDSSGEQRGWADQGYQAGLQVAGDILQVRRPGRHSLRGHCPVCPPQQEKLTEWPANFCGDESQRQRWRSGGPGRAGGAWGGEESSECAGCIGAEDHHAQGGKQGREARPLGQVKMEMFNSVKMWFIKETINIIRPGRAQGVHQDGYHGNLVFKVSPSVPSAPLFPALWSGHHTFTEYHSALSGGSNVVLIPFTIPDTFHSSPLTPEITSMIEVKSCNGRIKWYSAAWKLEKQQTDEAKPVVSGFTNLNI